MTRWRVTWTASARNYCSKMDSSYQARLREAVKELEEDPRGCRNVKRLHGRIEGLYRYRVGKLRMIFRIVPDAREVRLLAIASRGDIY